MERLKTAATKGGSMGLNSQPPSMHSRRTHLLSLIFSNFSPSLKLPNDVGVL